MDDKQKPRIVPLPERNQMKAAVDQLARTMPEMLEHVKLMAQIRRASFVAHVEAGFTEAQALELCRVL